MKKELKEKIITHIETLQEMANEFKPDEGILEEEEEQELNEMTSVQIEEEISNDEIKNVMSWLVYFCGEWFPEEWFDDEELEEYQKTLSEAEKLIKDEEIWNKD